MTRNHNLLSRLQKSLFKVVFKSPGVFVVWDPCDKSTSEKRTEIKTLKWFTLDQHGVMTASTQYVKFLHIFLQDINPTDPFYSLLFGQKTSWCHYIFSFSLVIMFSFYLSTQRPLFKKSVSAWHTTIFNIYLNSCDIADIHWLLDYLLKGWWEFLNAKNWGILLWTSLSPDLSPLELFMLF